MKEKELDEMLSLSEKGDIDEQINKKIKKGMTKAINFRIIKVLICLTLFICLLWYGIPSAQKITSYNPKAETNLTATNNDDNEKGEYNNFHILMQDYVGLNFPGLTYLSSKEEDHGNGSYTIYAKLHESASKLIADGSYNSIWKINQSRMEVTTDENHILSRIVEEYKGVGTNNTAYYELSKKTIQDIKELPDSASLNVSISFSKIKTGKEVIDFMNQYKTSFFSWLALKNVYEKTIAEGMTLWQSANYDLSQESNEKYPNFYLPNQDKLTEDVLLENYLSNLKLLIDHKDFIKVMQTMSSDCSIETLQKRYDDAKKTGIQAIGIRGWVKKNDLLKMIEKDGLDCIGIGDVKLSSLQK